jgi:hypothetical protein
MPNVKKKPSIFKGAPAFAPAIPPSPDSKGIVAKR